MANQRLNAIITIGGAVSGSLKSALGTTNGKLQSIGQSITKLKDRQKELNRAIAEQEKLGKGGSALKVQYANAEIGAINKEIEALRRKGDMLRKELELSKRIKDARADFAGKAISRAAGAVAIGGAVAAPAFSLLKESAQFNYDLQMIGNTADMTKQEITALGKSIMDASKVTGQSATSLQKAIGFLVAAGMDVKTANESIVTIGRAATASGADIEDLSRAAFTLNDSLKIAPKDLAGAIDILAQAGKEGNVELKDMAKQLPVLGSGFQALKMQGTEATATMGAALEVARKGAADADEAANNMKNFIAKIMSPETLKKAEKNFNLDLYAVIQKAQTKGKNPFEAAMQAIMKATKGDQKAIGELFSDMQVQNFIRPMIQNWDEYIRIKDKALHSSGVTDRDFAKVLATSKMQMDLFGQSAERIRLTLGDTMEATFGKVAGALLPVMTRLETFIENNRELVGNTMMVVGALGALGTAVFAVGAAIAGLAWAGTYIIGGLVMLKAAIVGISAALVANPIGAAIAGIAVAGLLIYQYWGPIKAWAVEFWASITATTTKGIDAVKNMMATGWAAAGALFRSAWEPIRDWFKALWQDMIATVTSAVEWISSKLQWIGQTWGATKQMFGGSAAPSSAPGMTPPTPPPMATARAGSNQSNTYNNEIKITQNPGESSAELADRIVKRIKQRDATDRRGIMFDSAMAGAY